MRSRSCRSRRWRPCRGDATDGRASRDGAAQSFGVERALDERVVVDELVGVGVRPLDVGLELAGLDAPLTAAADLDRLELLATHERVDLRAGDVQHLGHVGQLQEPRRAFTAHSATGRVAVANV